VKVESVPPAAGRVFISYRREETAWQAGWLFDRLVDRFGRDQIFKDIDSIQLGDDFVEVITAAVGSCDVLLALIGERWLTITDEHGTARLDDPEDFVRLEIEAALARNVRVIPILVEGARMPHPDQLSPSLAKLANRHALELSPSRFEFDTGRLLKVLDSTLADVHAELAGTEPDPRGAAEVHVLPDLSLEAPADPLVLDSSTGERRAEPVGPPTGPVATAPRRPRTSAGAPLTWVGWAGGLLGWGDRRLLLAATGSCRACAALWVGRRGCSW
jgi:TIR domain